MNRRWVLSWTFCSLALASVLSACGVPRANVWDDCADGPRDDLEVDLSRDSCPDMY
jgi:hypothetical protein